MAHGQDHNIGVHPIPRPIKISHAISPILRKPGSLASQMRLDDSSSNLRVYCNIVTTIGALADKHKRLFDEEGVTGRSMAWEGFMEMVRHQLPIINSYEDAWPVIDLVREHRHRTKQTSSSGLQHFNRKHGRRLGVDSVSTAPLNTTTSTGMNHQSQVDALPGSLPTRRCRSDRGSLRTVATCPAGPSSTSGPDTHGPSVQPEQGRHTEAPPRRENDSGIRASVSVPATDGPVVAFLGSLCPDQSALLPVFLAAGIADGAALNGVARMEGRNKWLYSLVREGTLTELQFIAVVAGLDKMRSG
ncbi:hypothetical protein C8Q78DRAFT_1036160 [Trametes maxima]|nr:hypothetical protein C8Q78DRAFT_1036160 [Trametes maxima]